MDALKHFFNSIAQMWKGLAASHRVALACLVALLAFTLVWGFAAAFSPGYVRLVGSDDTAAARAVQKALNEANYRNYETRWDGIYVPAKERDRLLLDTLPVFTDEDIYGPLLNQSFTSTSLDRKIGLRIARQRKVERMIGGIESIDGVSVTITPGSKWYENHFEGDPPTAAVTIRVKPGRKLTSHNVLAIARLVAASATGLKPQNVVVVDEKGLPYPVHAPDSIGGEVSGRLEAEQRYQKMLEDLVRRAVLRPASIAVRVILDPSRYEKKYHRYEGEPRRVSYEKIETDIEENDSADEPSIKNEGKPVRDTWTYGRFARREHGTEDRARFANGVEQGTQSTPAGQFVEAGVSVVIPLAPKEGEDREAFLAANQSEIAVLTECISKATLIPKENISVAFALTDPVRPIPGPAGWELFTEFFHEWGGTLLLWGLAIFALVILLLVLKSAIPKDALSQVDELRKRLLAEPAPVSIDVPSDEPEIRRIRITITEMIRRNARGVANVVKRWLKGE